MKAFYKKCLAALLTVAMILSMIPASVFAVQQTGTYSKISSAADLTSGKYVLVCENNRAAGAYDTGTKALPEQEQSVVENSIINPAESLVWNVVVSGSSISLQDSKGKYLTSGGNSSISAENTPYYWKVLGETTFTFNEETGTRVLAYNTNTKYFRQYAATGTNPKNFTLYKFVEGSIAPATQADEPKASKAAGVVTAGTQIELTCTTKNATILYKLSPEAEWQTYSTPIVINGVTTIYAKAQADGLEDSAEVTFAYTVPTMPSAVDIDPITEIPEGAISIAEALEKADNETITVVGQLVYRFGNYNNTNSAILEDVIDGQVVALQIYNPLDDYKIGDILKITAVKSTYGEVPQISAASKIEKIASAADVALIPAQEFESIGALLASKQYLLSEWIKLKNITLNAYNSNGNTEITDTLGTKMNVFRSATYPYDVEAGDLVDVYACVSKYKTNDQLRLGSSTDYVVVNDTKAPKIELTETTAELGQDCKVTAVIRDNVGVTEAKLTYTVGANPAVELSLVQNTEDGTKWEATIPGNVFIAGVDSVTVKVNAKDAKNNADEKAMTVKVMDEPQVESVTPARNAITGDNKKPLISITCTNIGTKPTAKLTLKKGTEVVLDQVPMGYQSETFSYQVASDLAEARYTASVTVTRADGKSITYEWPFTTGTPEYRLYFGQLHSHTTYSDGSGTLDSALEYVNQISEKDNIDFVAFTDHSNYFDTKDAVNPEDGLYDTSKMTADSQRIWKEYKTKVATYNASPSNRGVVAVAGYEMTWSGGPGHMNTFNTPGVVSRNNKTLNNKTNDAGMKAYYALLSRAEGENSISQFNHPGTTFGTFADFGYWDTVIDSRINMVEVGNGEGAIGSGGHFPSYNYYTMALDKGWHVAPTNNQDNHKGKWGNANDARDVIITDSLTEENIYQAMRERRIYATEDKNLEITYTVNDKMMGTIIEEVPESLTIKASLSDADDTIEKAELIANSGRVVYTWDVNAQSKELTATLNPDYSYYYLRVTESDGDVAVTAPVWVGKTIMLGISNVESSTSTPVTDEEITVKTTLFNSEGEDAVIKSLTYKLDGTVLENLNSVGTITKSTTFEYNYGFTPKKAKLQKITVEAVIQLGDKEFIYSKDLSLDVRDASKLVYVGIDGSHYNEYVSGNYKDSMGNFTKMAAQNNVRCVTLNTSEEFLAAARNTNGKYKMLVLTAPSRRNGTALRDPYAVYSDDEIAAIKGFSEAGGILVIGNWSDYYENYSGIAELATVNHMAGQQNKLLKAIGSKLRVSDDATMDDTLNGGQPQRLYFSSYNLEHLLMKDVEHDAEHPNDNKYSQLFSQYGGSSIYAVDESGNPSASLPDSVSPIVYGHATTYSKDSDKDGIGGEKIPKYTYAAGDGRLLVLASETITHANGNQSMVLVGGAAFMSN
ncbi:CehA/McbA family metallohydrolase, partial [Acetivibrio ethanolgignens]|uniref:CehA/McbA family metallohydrolase n=1 Tax=Acetivibrio ethanolgignens TaxID=290052 RepID=UPI000AB4DB4A